MIEIQADSLDAGEHDIEFSEEHGLEIHDARSDEWESFVAAYLCDWEGATRIRLLEACEYAFNNAWPNGAAAAHQAGEKALARNLIEMAWPSDGADSLNEAKGALNGILGSPVVRKAKAPEKVPVELLNRTFLVEHNPNCPSPWLVRLPGGRGFIDKKPYGQVVGNGVVVSKHETQDALGFGKTLAEAGRAAIAAAELLRGDRSGA